MDVYPGVMFPPLPVGALDVNSAESSDSGMKTVIFVQHEMGFRKLGGTLHLCS